MSSFAGEQFPGGIDTCDCVIRTDDGEEIAVHRAFLRTLGPYFDILFRGEHGDAIDLAVGGVKSAALKELLTFYYTDKLRLNNANVRNILEVADMLLLDDARDRCLAYLLRFLSPDNCVEMTQLAQRYYCPKFEDAVWRFMHGHFQAIWCTSKKFPDAPAELLLKWLSSDELNVRHEEDLLYALYRWSWCSLASGNELPPLRRLLHCVRVGLCSQEALEKVRARCPTLAERPEYKVAVDDALARGCCSCPSSLPALPQDAGATGHAGDARSTEPEPESLSENAVDNSDENSSPLSIDAPEEQAIERCIRCGGCNLIRWQPRLPHEVIVVVGGFAQGELKAGATVYNPRTNSWHQYPSEGFEPRTNHGMVLLGKYLYVVGGKGSEGTCMRSVQRLNLSSGDWERCSSMNVPRSFVAVVALGMHLYAIGGNTGARGATERTASVERYSIRTNQWTTVASMNRIRSGPAACEIKGKIYVSGGFNGDVALRSVEVYSPNDDSWRLVCPMPSPRHSHRMVYFQSHVYVIGGHDGMRYLNTVMRSRFNGPRPWQMAPPMAITRTGFAVAEVEDELYVVGGYTEERHATPEVECYSPRMNAWRRVAPINEAMYGMAGCVVKDVDVAKHLFNLGKS